MMLVIRLHIHLGFLFFSKFFPVPSLHSPLRQVTQMLIIPTLHVTQDIDGFRDTPKVRWVVFDEA